MSDYAFETWTRIVAGAVVLASGFGLIHILGRMVTGQDGTADAATAAISLLVFGSYLAVGGIFRRNRGQASE